MKPNLLFKLLILSIIIFSCTNKQTVTIKGKISSTEYEGKTIYLSSIDADVNNIDSTSILNGKFKFKGKIIEPTIKVLKIPPVRPHYMENLLVVIEPGIIKATIDIESTGLGTKLNDTFQNWKDLKQESDSIIQLLFKEKYKLKQIENQDIFKIDSIQFRIQEAENKFVSTTIQIILNNNQNVLGLYLFKIYYSKIENKEKEMILSSASEDFLTDNLVKRIYNDLSFKSKHNNHH